MGNPWKPNFLNPRIPFGDRLHNPFVVMLGVWQITWKEMQPTVSDDI